MPLPKVSGPSVQSHISTTNQPSTPQVSSAQPQAPQRTARNSQGELSALSARGKKRPLEGAEQRSDMQPPAKRPRVSLPGTHGKGSGDADARMESIMQMQAETMIRGAQMQNRLNRTNIHAKLMEAGTKAAKDLIS